MLSLSSLLLLGLATTQLAIANPLPEPAKKKPAQCTENTYTYNGCTWEVYCSVQGSGDEPIQTTTAKNINQCIDQCAATPSCRAVNFQRHNGGTCEMHTYIYSINQASGYSYAVANGCAS